MPVIIHPPWWRTWWAYALYVVGFAAGGWQIVEYRSRSLKREKQRLETKVAERTAEVIAQNEEIIQQNEEIAAQRDHVERQFLRSAE